MVVTFYFLLGSSIQCLLSVGTWSYLTQRERCRKMGQIYLSIVEEYFSVEVTHNLCIGLINKHSNQKVVLMIWPSFLNIVFSLVFKHRTDWCSNSRLLYSLMICFQIIAPQCYNTQCQSYYLATVFLCRVTIRQQSITLCNTILDSGFQVLYFTLVWVTCAFILVRLLLGSLRMF